MRYRVLDGINWRPSVKDAEVRNEPGDVVELPAKVAAALGDAVEKVDE